MGTAASRRTGRGPAAAGEPAVEVAFRPQGPHAGLPVEVFDGGELRRRIPATQRGRSHRRDFHLLLLQVDGETVHDVDFATYSLTAGTALRIRPGQTHGFVDPDRFPSFTILWRAEHQIESAGRPPWFPGGPHPTRFELSPDTMERVLGWVHELRFEQERFDGSARRADLVQTILRALLLLVEEDPGEPPHPAGLPPAYVELRQALELALYDRPSVHRLAYQLGYSSRTLDRVCHAVSGQTARQVVDERIGLELRRLLSDESVPIGQIRRSFGFDEASNFTKYVRRVVGRPPGEFRRSFGPDERPQPSGK